MVRRVRGRRRERNSWVSNINLLSLNHQYQLGCDSECAAERRIVSHKLSQKKDQKEIFAQWWWATNCEERKLERNFCPVMGSHKLWQKKFGKKFLPSDGEPQIVKKESWKETFAEWWLRKTRRGKRMHLWRAAVLIWRGKARKSWGGSGAARREKHQAAVRRKENQNPAAAAAVLPWGQSGARGRGRITRVCYVFLEVNKRCVKISSQDFSQCSPEGLCVQEIRSVCMEGPCVHMDEEMKSGEGCVHRDRGAEKCTVPPAEPEGCLCIATTWDWCRQPRPLPVNYSWPVFPWKPLPYPFFEAILNPL